MTVYVGMGIADKPRVQHLARPSVADEYRLTSLCQLFVMTAEDHDRQRRHFGFRRPLTPIRYEDLPMCKRCTRRQEGTHQ